MGIALDSPRVRKWLCADCLTKKYLLRSVAAGNWTRDAWASCGRSHLGGKLGQHASLLPSLRVHAGRELHIAYGCSMETTCSGAGVAGMLSFTGAHETRAAQSMRLPAPGLTCGWCPGKAGQQPAEAKLPSSPGSEPLRATAARVPWASAAPFPILTICRQLCSGCCRYRRCRRCCCCYWCSLCMQSLDVAELCFR